MKKTPLLLPVLGVLFLAGCSSIETHVDYDRGANFSSYHTFAFKDVREPQNPIGMKRVRTAIVRTLSSRGYTEAPDGTPDLWVVLHSRAHSRTQVTSWNTGWGWGWRWRGPYWTTARVEQIPVGTLMVDLVDTKAKELVFRGSASRVVDPDESPQTREEKVQQAVDKIFEGFPPKR